MATLVPPATKFAQVEFLCVRFDEVEQFAEN
jgi:hypothetical protein